MNYSTFHRKIKRYTAVDLLFHHSTMRQSKQNIYLHMCIFFSIYTHVYTMFYFARGTDLFFYFFTQYDIIRHEIGPQKNKNRTLGTYIYIDKLYKELSAELGKNFMEKKLCSKTYISTVFLFVFIFLPRKLYIVTLHSHSLQLFFKNSTLRLSLLRVIAFEFIRRSTERMNLFINQKK